MPGRSLSSTAIPFSSVNAVWVSSNCMWLKTVAPATGRPAGSTTRTRTLVVGNGLNTTPESPTFAVTSSVSVA